MRKGQKAILLYMSEDIYQKLSDLSCKTCLSKSKLIRYLILGYTPPEGPPVNYDELIFQLRAIGNNINQILYIARTNGILNQKDLQKHLTDLRNLEKKMDAAFDLKRS